MLEKYRGWLIGTIIALYYRWSFMPVGYNELVQWLGPILGDLETHLSLG